MLFSVVNVIGVNRSLFITMQTVCLKCYRLKNFLYYYRK